MKIYSITNQVINFIKKYNLLRKWWFYILIIMFSRFAFNAANSLFPVSYDHIALGFQNEEVMMGAFSKGYHNRQKLEEMQQRDRSE